MLTPLGILIIVSAFLIVYSYVLYPLALILLGKLVPESGGKTVLREDWNPSVAILCAMYNEEDVAEDKIFNFRSLRYSNLQLYIGSDGSSDRTNEILDSHANEPGLKVFCFPRRGKVHVLNDLIDVADEDVLVFTDANSMFEPDAVTALVRHLRDPRVGAVCGKLTLIDREKGTGEGFYWRYETMLKRAESTFRCVVGGNGAIYAVRRELVTPLPPNTINDDFTISMRVLERGYGMTYAADAVATEDVGADDATEFRRHVRDGAGHYRAMMHLAGLLNPLCLKRFLFYMSHRVIRWFVPHLMLISLLLPFWDLTDPWSKASLSLQGLFYILVFLGWVTGSTAKYLYVPFYFFYINMALMVGFFRNLLGLQKVTWNRTQRA